MTVAGGLRYETGREMPPGMQELYGMKLAGEMRDRKEDPSVAALPQDDDGGAADDRDAEIAPQGHFLALRAQGATPAEPARNDRPGGAGVSDEELLAELQDKAMGLGMDVRWLVNELIKRYKIRKFEDETLAAQMQEKV